MTGALLGMLASVVSMTAVMMVANLIITPFYMGVSTSDVVQLIPTLLLPFNLTKGIFNASIVILIYKPDSKAIRLAGFVSVSVAKGQDGPIGVIPGKSENGKKSVSYIITVVVAALVAVLSLVYFIVKLGGSFSIK